LTPSIRSLTRYIRLHPRDGDPHEEHRCGFVRLPLGPIEPNEPLQCLLQTTDGHLGSEPAELRPFVGESAPYEHEILRDGLRAHFADAPLEPQARNVMPAATVGAAADLDSEIRRRLNQVRSGAKVVAKILA
jgi:hypothetical protein